MNNPDVIGSSMKFRAVLRQVNMFAPDSAVWIEGETGTGNGERKCRISISMAERELGAFTSAVIERYGPRQARIAAEEWIEEFESSSDSFGFTTGEWRKITIAAASRLAPRLGQSRYRTTRLREAMPHLAEG